MTIKELLDSVQALCPHTYQKAELMAWLDQVERHVWEMIGRHEQPEGLPAFEGYDEDTNEDTVLTVTAPYNELYQFYLAMKISLWNRELNEYNNFMLLYSSAFDAFAAAWNREYRTIRTVGSFLGGSGRRDAHDPLSDA